MHLVLYILKHEAYSEFNPVKHLRRGFLLDSMLDTWQGLKYATVNEQRENFINSKFWKLRIMYTRRRVEKFNNL